MLKQRRKFTRDFKNEAVRLTEEAERSVASVARELRRVESHSTLYINISDIYRSKDYF